MQRSVKIEAVVFDVGNVLFDWDLRYLFRKLIPDAAECEYFVTHVVTAEWHFQHDEGRPLADMVAERIAEFPQHGPLIKAYANRFNETAPAMIPGMESVVQGLLDRQLPLYAITNFGHDLWARFRPTQPIFDDFTDIVVSGTEKLAKPDPAIFALAEHRFGRPAASMLFIDDRADNIAAAEKCGFIGHHFTTSDALIPDLRRYGLLD
jgi:2-haloacid dehalogenase